MTKWIFMRSVIQFTWSDWLWIAVAFLSARMLVIVFWLSIFMVYL